MASLLLGSRWDHEHEEEEREQGDEFADPLGASSLTSSPSLQPPFFPFAIAKATSRFEAHQHRHSSSASSGPASDALALAVASDWNSYKASVMHRFASTGTITVTTGLDILSKEPKGHKKSVTAAHLEQLEDSDKEAREEFKIISQQEYVMRLRELNEEIALAWLNNERVSALRLTIKEVELNILLKDIWKHLSKGDVLEAVLISLESIVFKLVSHYNDLTKVLNLVHVVEILDFFVGDIRLSVYKRVLTSVTRTNQKIIDPVTRHIVLEQGRVLHDSLDSLSSDDERRQITRLIARLVQLVDYGLDLEQHLEFLVECRATFGNMDLIRETVVHISNRLAITALQFAMVSPSKQTKDFVKACLTFNGITIPSITSIIQRMHLFLETAEAALMNKLLSHTEGLVKNALMCLQDNSNGDGLKVKEYEEAISSFLQKLVSFLVFMPGHPELGAFYILRGILGLLDSKPGLASGRGKVRVLCGIICMLAAVGHVKGLHPVIGDHVDSNELLYYEDPSYQEELAEITANVVDMVMMSLDHASDKVQGGYQYLDACNALITAFKVDVDTRTRCSEFLRKASASLPESDNYLQLTLDYAQRKGDVIIS